MATRLFVTTEWEHDWQTRNQHKEDPRWLICPADEFIRQWLPKFESGELRYEEAGHQGQSRSAGKNKQRREG